MRFPKIIISYLALCTLISCENRDVKAVTLMNDTTSVIRFAIAEAFRDARLPEIEQLRRRYYFKNQILLTSDSLPLELLPGYVDTINFKVLSKEEICKMISADSLEQDHPNYLCVNNLMKNDSGYYLNIGSLSCVPFGGGGIMGIDISKRNDSFVVIHKGFSNVN